MKKKKDLHYFKQALTEMKDNLTLTDIITEPSPVQYSTVLVVPDLHLNPICDDCTIAVELALWIGDAYRVQSTE